MSENITLVLVPATATLGPMHPVMVWATIFMLILGLAILITGIILKVRRRRINEISG